MKGVYPTNISDPYVCLAFGIVENAVDEYREACTDRRYEIKTTGKVSHRTKARCKELESFFKSEWFTLLCPYDGKTIMHACQKEGYVVPCLD